MFLRKILQIISILFLLFGGVLFSYQSVSATTTSFGQGLYHVLDPAGIDERGSTTRGREERVIGTLINTVLAFLGVIVLALVIYAGVLWTLARGNEQQVQKAKEIMLGGVIGLIIILTASALVNFVISQIGTALT